MGTQVQEPQEQGQGLVEYALILVLVSITVVAALGLLGQQMNGAFQTITNAIDGGAITSVSAVRTGGGNGNDVVITVEVSEPVTVTATDSQSGKTATASCSSSCTLTIAGVGDAAGTITVSDGVGARISTYGVKSA